MTGFLPAVWILAAVGIGLRVAGLAWWSWGPGWPFLARQCIVGLGLHLLALELARRRRTEWAIVATGSDYVLLSMLTPRLGTGSEFFLYALLHPFLALGLSRWPGPVRAVLGLITPVAFLGLRLAAEIPVSTGLVSDQQLRDLATLNVLVFVGLGMTMALSSLAVSDRIARRAERLAEGRSQLIEDIGHELRTPAAVLLTAAQGALSRERSPDEYQRTLGVVERHSRDLGTTVERMLELSRVERAEVAVQLRDDLLETLHRVVADFEEPAAERSVSIATSFTPLVELTDAAVLRRVVGNLLSNAIRYTPAGGRVYVELRAHGRQRCLTVRDEGPGIAPADLPHVFSRYWRGDRARTRKEGHLGLGLAIARRYGRLLGAELSAVSPPGEGASFTLEWQAPAPPPGSAPSASRSRARRRSPSR